MSRKYYIRNKPKDYSYRNDEEALKERRLRGKARVGNERDVFPRLVKVYVDSRHVLVYVYSRLAVGLLLGVNMYYLTRIGNLPEPTWSLFGNGVYTEDELQIFGKLELYPKTKEDKQKLKARLKKEYSNLTDCVDLKRIAYLET